MIWLKIIRLIVSAIAFVVILIFGIKMNNMANEMNRDNRRRKNEKDRDSQ